MRVSDEVRRAIFCFAQLMKPFTGNKERFDCTACPHGHAPVLGSYQSSTRHELSNHLGLAAVTLS